MSDVGLHHAMLGRDQAAAAALGGHLGAAQQGQQNNQTYTPEQQLQLSNLMASMCQV
jgi:hypothetical protein